MCPEKTRVPTTSTSFQKATEVAIVDMLNCRGRLASVKIYLSIDRCGVYICYLEHGLRHAFAAWLADTETLS